MEPRGRFTRHAAGTPAAGGSRGADSAMPAVTSGRVMSFAHIATFYKAASDYAETVGGFVSAGLTQGDPVMVAVPRPNALVLRNYLGQRADLVTFADMATLGLNPGRIIPAVQAFAESHRGQPVRYIGEPVWRSRTDAELAEAMWHEALLNVAFAGQPIRILCPYNSATLDPGVLAEAEQTHPELMNASHITPSPAFAGPGVLPVHDCPLPDPPDDLEVLAFRGEPRSARAFIRERARSAGLREPKLTDLVIAVGELAANTLRHTKGSGTVRVWGTDVEVVCEVHDSGHIRDSLAGRRYPAADAGQGHGLWVVHQVCDLVEMRTGGSGTTFRLHMGLGR
jgi:anti-sigma regulatory factor (Ser/Thr protein kinase)